MKHASKPTNPFLVVRATVEADVPSPGILAISSALAGDGKTTVAAGIAQSLAGAGYRTLAVDASQPAKPGNGARLDEGAAAERLGHIVREAGGGCDYISVADLGADVSSAVAITALYAAIRARYEYAVIDTGILSEDGLAFARAADGVVLAVREGRAIADADREAVALMERVKARFLGVVATMDSPTASDETDNLAARLRRPSGVRPEPATNVKPVEVLRPAGRATSLFGRIRQTVLARTSTPE
jgi:succinoglycan biosynthesis transport protein ExoP